MNTFKLLLICILMFAIGLFGCISSGVSRAKAMSTDIDFNDLSGSDIESGMYVRGTVYELYDEYAYETTDSRVSERYYIMPLIATYEDEYPKFITLALTNADLQKKADLLMQQTWDYFDYGTEPAVWSEFEVVGKITKLDSELEDYLYEWFMYGNAGATRAEYSNYICPYEISFISTDGLRVGMIGFGIMAAIGAAGLAVFIVVFIRSRRSY